MHSRLKVLSYSNRFCSGTTPRRSLANDPNYRKEQICPSPLISLLGPGTFFSGSLLQIVTVTEYYSRMIPVFLPYQPKNSSEQWVKMKLNGEVLENVENFKCLRMTIKSKGRVSNSMSGWCKLFCGIKKIMQKRKMCITVKKRFMRH